MNWFQWFAIIWLVVFLVVLTLVSKRTNEEDFKIWAFFIGVIFVVIMIPTMIIHGETRDKSNDPVYAINPGSFPDKWLGDKININGETLEITGYNTWKNHFEMSNGSVVEFNNPKIKTKYAKR